MSRRNDTLLIGICTFRRPGIAETLGSLAGLDDCGLPVSIAVADNDHLPSAEPLIRQIAAGHPLPITYLHAPAANISIARNALLDHARATGARLLASMDDDETASAPWLAELVRTWRASGAGAVLGPVLAEYPPGTPAWMAAARLHDTLPVSGPGGVITTGYCGNVLIDMTDPALRELRFDPARGRAGGEDSAFFAAFVQAGGRIASAPAAILSETVPADRARLAWLLRRRYRMGQTHAGLIGGAATPLERARAAALAGAKALACGGLAAAGVLSPVRRNRQLVRAALHVGAVAHLAGARTIELYGAAEPQEPADQIDVQGK